MRFSSSNPKKTAPALIAVGLGVGFLLAVELSFLSENHPVYAMISDTPDDSKPQADKSRSVISKRKRPRKISAEFKNPDIISPADLAPAKPRTKRKIVDPQVALYRNLRPLFRAICHVESHDRPWATGDRGRSRGCYQISHAYWKDACKFAGARLNYYDHVWDKSTAERIMIWYWKRYCPHALESLDFETLARIHNGGPRGDRKYATLRYWRKVKHALRQNSKRK